MRTSYSALETFKTCPQKYKFEAIDKIRAPKNIEALFGSTVHSVLKFMFSKSPLFPTLDEVMSDFSDKWKNMHPKIVPAVAIELASAYENSGRAILKNFYKNNPPWNFSVVDTESHFEVPIESDKGDVHTLAGFIDRIDKIGDGEFEIIDYKTNRRLPSQSDADNNLQMSIYHMALKRRWPAVVSQKIKLSLYFLKHEEKISSYRSEKDLDATKGFILDTINKIENNLASNHFSATPSKLCDFCPYKKICPAWKHLYKENTLLAPNEAELETTVADYFAIKETEASNEKRLKELQAIIRAYMDQQGIDRVFDRRGYYISKKVQQRFKYDFTQIKAIFASYGLENKWQELLSADDKKLKAILKTLPHLAQQEIEKQKSLIREFVVLAASTKPAKK